ncbi:5281_t:CDS:10 [Paraglomus occultum]|uniref:5281_t:CDS:1 n=1 Tax=Paraglomus occultum TaxID=144539 RepID=A0A9N8WNX3_9GLOM|nr:5281_t:CDS:10 [Paraglomus occultum]
MPSLPSGLLYKEYWSITNTRDWSIESFDIHWIQKNPLLHENRIAAHASLGKELSLLSGVGDQEIADKTRSLQKQLKRPSDIVEVIWERSDEIAKSQVRLTLSEVLAKVNIKVALVDEVGDFMRERDKLVRNRKGLNARGDEADSEKVTIDYSRDDCGMIEQDTTHNGLEIINDEHAASSKRRFSTEDFGEHERPESVKKKVKNKRCPVSAFSASLESQNIDDPGETESANMKENDEVRNITQEEAAVRNKLLEILRARQRQDKEAQKTFMTSISLNGIIDLTDKSMYKEVTTSLSEDEAIWLQNFLQRKVWKPTPEFQDYIAQFTEESCTRAQIPSLVRKSHVVGRFDPVFHEDHDIAQQISTHLSVRLEAPMRVEYKGLDYERTFAIDTIVYILNRLYRMHHDDLDVAWIEHQTPDTKSHKIDGVFKVIRTTGKGQTIIMIEFSRARKTSCNKKEGDGLKLCRNAMRILNKLLRTVPRKQARIYLVQSFNGYIEVKYMVTPTPSIYILERSLHFKIPVSFGDFEDLGSTLTDLMNWQADVLSTVRAFNKVTTPNNATEDNNLHITSVQDTPLKKTKATKKNKPFDPGTPCPGSPCSFDSI